MPTPVPSRRASFLALHASDTLRRLFPALLALGLFTGVVGYVELEYLQLSRSSPVSNLPMMHSLLGFAISMLLVFRTNAAYDRWWEARKLLGRLISTSRNTAIKLASILPEADEPRRSRFAALIGGFAREVGMLLRAGKMRPAHDEPRPDLPGIDRAQHVPSQISAMMHRELYSAYRDGVISGDELIGVVADLTGFMEICGSCERIKSTPVPYSYSSFLKKFIGIYSLTLPFGYVFSLGYLAIPVVIFIFYVLASLELIAEEIENPFGTDANDLPLDRLTAMIATQCQELLR